jgi:Heavy metal binding domain
MKTRAFVIVLAGILFATVPAAQLPAVSWTCPMHPDVLEDKKARCGICGMDLEPVRLVTMYTCPVHAVIEQAKPGKCRICARDLVQMTAALTFTCSSNREVNQIEPGKCPDGSAMVPRYVQRAHGDHNSKHGGTFFMAPDNWHHIEGTYPAAGRFRVYVYDDYSKPLSLAEARKVRGRVVTKEVFDPKTGATRELASAPLVLARNGAFFEARFDSPTFPARLTAKISFRSGDKESRFDFAFPEYSKDQPPRIASASAANAATADRPNAPDQLLTDLNARRAEVETMLKSGNYAAIYVPALQAKDAALEIQTRHNGARGIDQDALEANVKQIVLAAYQLDNYGDIGDGLKVQEAFATFNAAISALDSLVTGTR